MALLVHKSNSKFAQNDVSQHAHDIVDEAGVQLKDGFGDITDDVNSESRKRVRLHYSICI